MTKMDAEDLINATLIEEVRRLKLALIGVETAPAGTGDVTAVLLLRLCIAVEGLRDALRTEPPKGT